MIFRIVYNDGSKYWCTAKNVLHLLQRYDEQFDLELQEIESIDELTEAEEKEFYVHNTSYDPTDPQDMDERISLWDLAVGDEFAVIASNECWE